MSKHRQRVFAHVKQDIFLLDSGEDFSVWAGSADVSSIAAATNHREGSQSVSFAKSGTTQAYGEISRTLDEPKDISEYYDGKLRMWVYLSSLTNIVSVSLIIGENSTDNYVYTTLVASLSTGWNLLEFSVNSPTSTGGAGAAWSSINYIAARVTFSGAGNTLTGILVDAIRVLYVPDMNIERLEVSGTGLATEAKQDTGNTSLSSIDGKLSPGAMQSQGTDATGQDTYATIKTPSADAKHIYISLEGSNAAIISLDAGTTDHITVQGGSVVLLDDVTITSGVAIQAKNRTGGSNYTNLNISIW